MPYGLRWYDQCCGRGTDPFIPLDRDSYAGADYLDRTEFNIADIEAPGTPRLSRERGRLAAGVPSPSFRCSARASLSAIFGPSEPAGSARR